MPLRPEVLIYVMHLLTLLYRIIMTVGALGLALPATFSREVSQLIASLADELSASEVLNHAARTMLLLALAQPAAVGGGRGGEDFETVTRAFGGANAMLFLLVDKGGTTAEAIRRVQSGLCVQHAGAAMGLAALRAAYGNSAPLAPGLGLPPALLSALSSHAIVQADRPGFTSEGRGATRRQVALFTSHSMCMPRLFVNAAAAQALLLSRRGALQLTLRTGWLAVVSARYAPAESGGGHGGGRGFGRRDFGLPDEVAEPVVLLPARGAAMVALEALEAARTLLLSDYPAPARAQGQGREQAVQGQAAARLAQREAEELAAWWRLNVAVAVHVTPHALGNQMGGIGGFLCFIDRTELPLHVDPLRLPRDPAPEVAAALEAGALRCVELLLREAGRDPYGPAAEVVQDLLGQRSNDAWHVLAALLAHGEERGAAALLGTLCKLIRGLDPRVVAECGAEGPLDLVRFKVAVAVLGEPVAVSSWHAGQPQSPASEQLLRMLSLAACTLLPVASGLAVRAVGHARSRLAAIRVTRLLAALLPWVPLLGARCIGPPMDMSAAGAAVAATEGASGSGQDGAGGATTDDDASSWRALLLEEVRAVELLGVGLELVMSLALESDEFEEDYPGLLGVLASGCLVVADVCAAAPPPAAVPAAATAAAPSPLGRLTWRPEALEALVTRLRETYHSPWLVAAVLDLVEALEGASGVRGGRAEAPEHRFSAPEALSPLVLPPAAARSLLRTCANPGCANLEGDSEAGLRLQACGSYGAARYCGATCQAEHWRAGHKEACAQGRGARVGKGVAGGSSSRSRAGR
ncbi:hypothetical protein GPECTOR_68g374 [Gonium pectorale]|uniref:phytol kinase n=1 Tax=Gonium pectorale TaxID=33097 RepID=A0A150G3L0_GONPE|nr:hypothetical protein GPECTOR_68g374 [Gonium pectorale]|eukprot:KXZ44403.1 hypothetical protein GPECTOR_68g374 [Gonium pectorale]